MQDTLDLDSSAYDKANEDIYADIFMLTEAPVSLLVLKHEDKTGIRGNEQKTVRELVAKHNKVTNEVIRATKETPVNSCLEPGEDPDEYLIEKIIARSEHKIGDLISDRTLKGIWVQGFAADYTNTKLVMYRNPTFDINQMQSTTSRLYLDDLPRPEGSKGAIAGRGINMTAETSTCYICGKQRYYARNFQTNENKNDSWNTGAKGTAGRKRYSVQETNYLNDEDCYEQDMERRAHRRDWWLTMAEEVCTPTAADSRC